MNFIRKKKYSIKDYAKREVNLLPSEFYQISRQRIVNLLGIFIALSLVVSFGLYERAIYKETKSIEDETFAQKVMIQRNSKRLENQEIILGLQERIAVKEMLLDFIRNTNHSIVEVIDMFESKLNGEIYLNSLMANSYDAFVISASATSHEAITALINQLKHMEDVSGQRYFSDVFTNAITRSVDDEGNVLLLFQLECTFEGGLSEVK